MSKNKIITSGQQLLDEVDKFTKGKLSLTRLSSNDAPFYKVGKTHTYKGKKPMDKDLFDLLAELNSNACLKLFVDLKDRWDCKTGCLHLPIEGEYQRELLRKLYEKDIVRKVPAALFERKKGYTSLMLNPHHMYPYDGNNLLAKDEAVQLWESLTTSPER